MTLLEPLALPQTPAGAPSRPQHAARAPAYTGPGRPVLSGVVRRPPVHQGGQRGGGLSLQRLAPTPHELELRQRHQQLLRQQQLQHQQQVAPPEQEPGQPAAQEQRRGQHQQAATGQQQQQHRRQQQRQEQRQQPEKAGSQQQQQQPQQQQLQRQQQQQRRRQQQQQPVRHGGLADDIFEGLALSCGLEDSWRPQVSLLYRLGLRAEHFRRLAASRPEVFQMGLSNMKRKLRFLRDVVGLKEADMVKVLARFPRVLEYQSERTLRPRLNFLTRECGVAAPDLPRVVVRAPMLLELSVADTLAPRAAFLREEVQLPPASLGKLVLRHPQASSGDGCGYVGGGERGGGRRDWRWGSSGVAGRALAKSSHFTDATARLATNVLHYKIESMQERVNFLRSIGMSAEQVAAALARFPQLFSLNVAANMEPKWAYLVESLGGDVTSLATYPGYFSLSLHNRIIARHRFLLHARAAAAAAAGEPPPPLPPFPLGHLKCTDKQFAVEVAGSSLAEYLSFREELLAEIGGSSSEGSGDSEDSGGSDNDRAGAAAD
eukprot:scaffold2.g6820.t1